MYVKCLASFLATAIRLCTGSHFFSLGLSPHSQCHEREVRVMISEILLGSTILEFSMRNCPKNNFELALGKLLRQATDASERSVEEWVRFSLHILLSEQLLLKWPKVGPRANLACTLQLLNCILFPMIPTYTMALIPRSSSIKHPFQARPHKQMQISLLPFLSPGCALTKDRWAVLSVQLTRQANGF